MGRGTSQHGSDRSFLADLGIAHDQTLKQWFADSPAAALRFYAGPAAASVPANARLQLLRQEQVARILGRGHRIADVVLLAETASGLRQAFFIFEESAQPARAAVYQLLEYTVRFGQWLERNTGPFELTPVLDVLGEGSLDGRVELNGATRRTLQFECEVRRIAHMDPVEALGSRDPVAITNVMNMHVAPERRVALCAEAIVLLDELLPREHFRKYGEYVLACARLSAEQRVELDERLRE